MGQSTDAIIAFGYDVGNTDEWPDGFYLPDDESLYDLQETKPVQLVRHCSCDYPMWFIAVNASVAYASRGSPQKLKAHDIEYNTTWTEMVILYAKEHNLPDPDLTKVGWHIMSDWC